MSPKLHRSQLISIFPSSEATRLGSAERRLNVKCAPRNWPERCSHTHTHTHTHMHTHLPGVQGHRGTAPESYHVKQEVCEPVGPVAQAAHVLQPLGPGHPVPHHGAADGRREDGEAKHDAQGDTALADALQAAAGAERASAADRDPGLLLLLQSVNC